MPRPTKSTPMRMPRANVAFVSGWFRAPTRNVSAKASMISMSRCFPAAQQHDSGTFSDVANLVRET